MNRLWRVLLCSLFFATVSSWAAEAAAAAASDAGGSQIRTLKQVLDAGGWVMYIIFLLSILGTFLVFYFLFTLRKNVLQPPRFMREAEDAAEEGDFEALQAICERNNSMAARVIGAAAQQFSNDLKPDYTYVRDAIQDEGNRQAGFLWQQVQYILDIAVLAPMLGFLGTVVGMLQSFTGMSVEVGVRPTVLAAGVAKALITTVGGLCVGIPAMALYSLFRGRVVNLVSQLEASCNRVLRKLVAKQSVTVGTRR